MARAGRRQSTNRRGSQRRYSAERPRKKNQRKSPYKKKGSFKKTQSRKKSTKKVTPAGNRSGSSIIVRNLDPAVTEADVREIFSRVGKLKSAVVQYNAKGKSRGIATVTFVTKANADKAARDYDQAEVDGRPMYVKIVNYSSPGSSATPVISKAKSVKKKTQQKNTKKKSTKKKPTPKKNQASKKKKTAKKTPKKGKKATKKGKKSPKKKKKKPVVTAEQLDAEMDEYHSKGTGSSKTGKSSTSLIAAGQPDPAKLFSIPTDMEE